MREIVSFGLNLLVLGGFQGGVLSPIEMGPFCIIQNLVAYWTGYSVEEAVSST